MVFHQYGYDNVFYNLKFLQTTCHILQKYIHELWEVVLSFSLSLCGIIKNHLIHISIVILLFRRKKTGHSSIFSSPAVVDGKWVYELCFTFILLLFLNFDFRMLCIIGYHIPPRGTRLTTPKIVVKI